MTVSTLSLGHGPNDARQSWRMFGGALALAAVLLGYFFWQEIIGATGGLGSTAFSHCFLVLPVVGYLIWERRGVLAGAVPVPDFRVLLLLPFLSVAWLLAAVLNILEGQQFLLMTMVQVMLLSVLGWRLYRLLLGPFLYLYLLVPSGEFLVPSLQDVTARFVVWLLGVFHGADLFGRHRDLDPRRRLHRRRSLCRPALPDRFDRFRGVLSMVVYRSWWRRAAFLALAVTVPVFANGVRAWGIIELAHLTNDVTAIEADHIIYGWGFFSAIILLLIFVGTRFADGGPVQPERQPGRVFPAFALRAPIVATVAAVALSALGPIYAGFLESARWRIDLAQATPPAIAAPWHLDAGSSDTWQPLVISPDREFRDAFTKGDRQVQRYMALYDAYGRHNNLVRSPNRIYDEDNWARTTLGTTTVTIDGQPATINTAKIRYQNHDRLVWYFYVVSGHVTSNPLDAKVRQAELILSGRSEVSAFVALATEDPDTPEGHPERVLADFLGATEPLAPYLATTREHAPSGAPLAAEASDD